MATIVETYEANTRMMKQNSEMLQEILRQVKSLAAHLGIVDIYGSGQIGESSEIGTKQDEACAKVHQVFDELPATINTEIVNHPGQDTKGDEIQNDATTIKRNSIQILRMVDIIGEEDATKFEEASHDKTWVRKFHKVFDKLPTTIDTEVDKQPIESSGEFDLQQDDSSVHGYFEEMAPFLVVAHKSMIELQTQRGISEVLKIATVDGNGAQPTNLVSKSAPTVYLDKLSKNAIKVNEVVEINDPCLFRLLVMEKRVKMFRYIVLKIYILLITCCFGLYIWHGHARVMLSDYLLAICYDCSHLSFDTYKSGKTTTLSQSQRSSYLANNLEVTLMASNGCSTFMHLNSRNLVYHDKEQLEFKFDSHKVTADARNYDLPKLSKSELGKLDIPGATTLGNDYVSCAFIPGLSFKNIEQSSFRSFVIDPNARNLSIFSQSQFNSMPSDILAVILQSTEARDFAAFLTSPSSSYRYYGFALSVKNLIVSMSQPSSQVLHSANPATGRILKEHLYAHRYAQSSYPSATQGHTYTQSILRQVFLDSKVFCEPHTYMKYDLQHYGSSSVSINLPWSSSYAYGYESPENPSNSLGSYLHNLLADSTGIKLAYDDFLPSQYNNGRDSGATFFDDNDISVGGKTVKKDAMMTHEILKDIIGEIKGNRGLLKQSSCLVRIFSCCSVIYKCTGSHYKSSDQHWLNNCTGKWNYIQFFTLMVSDLLLLILQWSTGILVHIYWGHSSWNLEDKVLFGGGSNVMNRESNHVVKDYVDGST